ncbi:flagellar basal body rod protein FlgB [Aquibacillus salsiterrae]|uniref:Flagellar basal body rod protein FlgB n=1 Tax=Aquibacillus salsiterrae TaxID=2950439 RepID=A0A9X3WG39_9BACI|nr:flagellar basal body rod protein FlgB [Aquibacillus salsiterrae]MDC3416401.1 flagellar basal body rod protein FlgB [Aquibacillus salsiterrae]
MSFFGKTVQQLERSLDFAALKNKTISNNIANADTPNYKAKQVVFKDVLENQRTSFEAKRTNPKHISFQQSNSSNSFKIVTNNSTTYNHNGNSVDIDKEMTDLAENQIYYQSLVDRLNGKFSSLETVIRGGR